MKTGEKLTKTGGDTSPAESTPLGVSEMKEGRKRGRERGSRVRVREKKSFVRNI